MAKKKQEEVKPKANAKPLGLVKGKAVLLKRFGFKKAGDKIGSLNESQYQDLFKKGIVK